MKTVFDKAVREELINRIQSLNDSHQAQWGKMNINQMISHMNIWNEWVFGKNNLSHKQGFLGKFIGKWMLKKDTKDDTPIAKGDASGKRIYSQ